MSIIGFQSSRLLFAPIYTGRVMLARMVPLGILGSKTGSTGRQRHALFSIFWDYGSGASLLFQLQ